MQIIGEHMAKVIEGQSTILEYLTKDNLLSRYYEEAMGIGYFSDYLAGVVAQIVHRYPHMRILEIGTYIPARSSTRDFTKLMDYL